MITRCDHCGSKFEVNADLVYSKDPSVRCGECMALFNSRDNLYDEAEHQKTAVRYSPVQRTKPEPVSESAVSQSAMAESVAEPALETADAGAVEHFYTSSVVAPSSTQQESIASTSSEPDIDLSGPVSSRSAAAKNYKQYQADERAVADVEFERTMATESALQEAAGAIDVNDLDRHLRDGSIDLPQRADGRRDDRPESRNKDGFSKDDMLSKEELKERRRRESSARERRALDIESPRGASRPPQPRDQVNGQVIGKSAVKDDAMRHPEQSPVRNRELSAEAGSVDAKPVEKRSLENGRSSNRQTESYDFIPDDVLQKESVYRDNGRRDENLQFAKDTPPFDTSVRQSDPATRNYPRMDGDPNLDRPDLDNSAGIGNNTGISYNTGTGAEPGPRVSAASDNRLARDRHLDLPPPPDPHLERRAREAEQRSLRESSAREMRRFQQDRKPVTVNNYVEESAADELTAPNSMAGGRRAVELRVDAPRVDSGVRKASDKSVVRSGSKSRPWLWALGAIALVCVGLFAARNVIANMNLPASLIGGFCNITGCVPAEAKKDLSQLQIMRDRLYAHPDIESALVISVDIVNNSTFKQPLPTLGVTLLDAEGETIAGRSFSSTSYELVEGGETGFLMPSEPTRLKIELVDTGLSAADIDLKFE